MPLRFLTAGESHGKALVGILEGLPAGLFINTEKIAVQMTRRKLGFGRSHRQKIEADHVEILAGIRHGKTIGSPIAVMIQNKDHKKWDQRVTTPRPGHADEIGGLKYNHADLRNVLERASARETAMRVALGSITRQFLEELNIIVASRVVQIGKVSDHKKMVAEIKAAKSNGDTLGGTFEVHASGLPKGLGSYIQWDKRLEGDIGKAILSLNGIKGVEVGLGFKLGELYGSEAHDTIESKTNRAGGITGGMTTGQDIVVRAVMKPISTLMKPLPSVDLATGKPENAHVERADVCAVPAASVISESLLALVIANAILEKFGGDSMTEILPRVHKWKETC